MHPQEWIQLIYQLKLFNTAPINAIAQAAGTMSTRSKDINWKEEDVLKMEGTVTDVYTNSSLASAYVSGGVVGSNYYLKVAEQDATIMQAGDALTIANTANDDFISAAVVNTFKNGASSWVLIRLLEADTDLVLAAASIAYTLQADARPEGSELPGAFFRDPTAYSNQTQISMGSIEFTGTELAESERHSPKAKERAQQMALARMMEAQEESMLFGVYSRTTGANGKELRRTRGVISALKAAVPGNIVDWTADTDYSGDTFDKSGLKWLRKMSLQFAAKATQPEKLVFTSLNVIAKINQAVEYNTQYNITKGESIFGIKVMRLTGLAQDWVLIPHPRFTKNTARQRSAFITERGLINKVVFEGRGMKYVDDAGLAAGGYNWVDGLKEGWVEEWATHYNNLESQGFLTGFGLDNAA